VPPPESSAAGHATRRLVVARVGSLPAPAQDAAVAAVGDRFYAFGGLRCRSR
jgi:hypothetical protein